jgi:hypothetical protein
MCVSEKGACPSAQMAAQAKAGASTRTYWMPVSEERKRYRPVIAAMACHGKAGASTGASALGRA